MKNRCSVLIIEDDPIPRGMAACILEDERHRIVGAGNAGAGMLCARKCVFHGVI